MTSFQDAPDENIEHDEKMELRSSQSSFIIKKKMKYCMDTMIQ